MNAFDVHVYQLKTLCLEENADTVDNRLGGWVGRGTGWWVGGWLGG